MTCVRKELLNRMWTLRSSVPGDEIGEILLMREEVDVEDLYAYLWA